MSELNEFQLKIQYWYLSHKKSIRKAFIFFLGVLDFLLLFYVFLNFSVYLFKINRTQRMIEEMGENRVAFAEYRSRHQVSDLIISDPAVILAAEGRYDLLAKIKNPNVGWSFSQFEYKFVWTGGESENFQSFILPQEEKFLFVEGIESSGVLSSNDLRLVIENPKYLKVNKSLPIQLSDLEIKNIEYEVITLTRPQTEENYLGTRVKGEVTNNSIYDFWEMGLTVVLYQGERPLAFDNTKLEKFISQETRPFEFIWDTAITGISKVEVKPEINLLDNSNIIQS